MKLGMPVIVVQVSRLNDPPQPGSFSLSDHLLFMPRGGLSRMGGRPRQCKDSQRVVINKSAHKEGGYLIFYFCFLLKQILSVLSGLTVNGFQAS